MRYVGCVLVVEDEDEYSNIGRTTISPVDMAASGKNLSVWLHILVQVYYNFTVYLKIKTQLLHDADSRYCVSLLPVFAFALAFL